MATTLGEELSASLTNITALIVKTGSKSQRARLTRQQAQIAGQLQVFIDKTVNEGLSEYRAATRALNAANAEAEKAKGDLDRVAATIKKFAAAIDKLAALAATIASA